MKKEYVTPVIITAVIVVGLIFSWQWYKNNQTSTTVTTTPPAAAKTT